MSPELRGSRSTSGPRRPPHTAYERTPGDAAAPLETPYVRRQPEKTLLYQFIAKELAAFLAAAREQSDYGQGIPGFIQRELLAYLDRGILARGFARVPAETLLVWAARIPEVARAAVERYAAARHGGEDATALTGELEEATRRVRSG